MSNFDFLKKDLKQKIVNLQGWELLAHISHSHKWHPIILSFRSRKNYILWNLDRVHLHIFGIRPFNALARLSSILVQERKSSFLGTPEMSGKLRYESQYFHTIPPAHAHAHRLFVRPYFLS
jgi:hypothetical protein